MACKEGQFDVVELNSNQFKAFSINLKAQHGIYLTTSKLNKGHPTRGIYLTISKLNRGHPTCERRQRKASIKMLNLLEKAISSHLSNNLLIYLT